MDTEPNPKATAADGTRAGDGAGAAPGARMALGAGTARTANYDGLFARLYDAVMWPAEKLFVGRARARDRRRHRRGLSLLCAGH